MKDFYDGYPQAFLEAVTHTLAHEGGYVDHPDDPGGKTKYGISKRQYPDLNIRCLTREQATHIYFEDFWSRYDYGRLNDGELAAKVFDLGVNMSPKRAHRLLQFACRANHRPLVEDGILGPKTASTVNDLPPLAVLTSLRSESAGYYRRLAASRPQMRTFLRGWLRRAYS